MNIMNSRMKELRFSEIILFHRCPTILNSFVLEFVIFALLRNVIFIAEDFLFLNFA